MTAQPMNRRRFFQLVTTGVAAFTTPTIVRSSALGADGRPGAGSRIIMAAVGVGERGTALMNQFRSDPRVQVVAVCDVQHAHLNAARNAVKDCKAYLDYREICAREDIDLVMCATPDHWHAQICIDAMKSGKDIYCEKPLSLTIREGRKMVQAARLYNRVFSCGSQWVIKEFGPSTCAARSGEYGKILAAHASPGGPSRPCYLGGVEIPKNTIAWDLWLGPAPWAPYHPYRCARGYEGKGFRSWYEYSGGAMTDWGGHKFGGAMHGLGVDHTGPVEIIPEDKKDNPHMTFVFANGMKLYNGGGQKFICEKGEAIPLKRFSVPRGLRWYEDGARSPAQDLINCVYTRKRPFRDVEYAHRVATVCHLGNICHRLNRKLRWDPDKEDFIGDPEASQLVDRARRGPWQI